MAPLPMIPGLDEIAFGGDYNPQGWPIAVREEDMDLMHAARVNLATIGVFTWYSTEPRQGSFDFTELDRIVEQLQASGVSVCLATPTAGPPAWFWKAHPEAHIVDRAGHTLGVASRGMACPSSPAYREASRSIAEALARRYGSHPAVKLWHVHNEYGAPVFECYCPTSVEAFRDWLRTRYGTIDRLNTAWGTIFWGQHYTAWDDIDAPRLSATVVNPTHRLDFMRFSNDELLDCYRIERDAIRAHSDRPITTNLMAANNPSPDYWAWAKEMDLISNDHYLQAERPDNHIELAMAADLTRSFAGSKPWMLMEHSTSAVNWQGRNIAKRPGEMTRNSLQHLARGADAILFFQFRAHPFGAEKFHSAMVPQAGPDSRIFREVCELGDTLNRLDQVRGSAVSADVALLWDPVSFWAQDLEWRPSADLNHRQQIERYYRILWDNGTTTDFAHPEADLSKYRLVIAPASYLVSDRASENLARFVASGGNLLVSYFSGIVNEDEQLATGPMPGQLREVLGVEIEEFLPLRANETVSLAKGGQSTLWAERLVLREAVELDTFADGPGAGGPAITTRSYGSGISWYVATHLSDAGLSELIRTALEASDIRSIQPSNDLEHVVRRSKTHVFDFWLNHSDEVRTIRCSGEDLLTGQTVTDSTIPAGGFKVLSRPL